MNHRKAKDAELTDGALHDGEKAKTAGPQESGTAESVCAAPGPPSPKIPEMSSRRIGDAFLQAAHYFSETVSQITGNR